MATNCSSKPLSEHDCIILDRIFNPNLPYSDVVQDQPVDEEEESVSFLEAKRLEVEGVKAAEAGDVMTAIDFFNQAITLEPSRPSGYNNRAQALRLIRDNTGAMADLDKAIELSHGQKMSACQAYTQRGLLNKLQGQDESALDDFQHAADLGGKFAKQMLVNLNPYAALCNQMMTEMISKMKSGEVN